jgi:hypothetical protein
MEAEELTWHSDHVPQAVLQQTLDQIWQQVQDSMSSDSEAGPIDLTVAGTSASNPIVISSDSDHSDLEDIDLLTDQEWDEYFAAGTEASEGTAIPVVTRTFASSDCETGSSSTWSSMTGDQCNQMPGHHLKYGLTSPLLRCTSCRRVSPACLTDRQVRLVAFCLMPELYSSINRKSCNDAETMAQLRMIVRLYGITDDGLDKIGHCLAGELIG